MNVWFGLLCCLECLVFSEQLLESPAGLVANSLRRLLIVFRCRFRCGFGLITLGWCLFCGCRVRFFGWSESGRDFPCHAVRIELAEAWGLPVERVLHFCG